MAFKVVFNYNKRLIYNLNALNNRYVGNYTSDEIPQQVLQKREKDLPIEIANPFLKPRVKCILCKHNITPDYKNVRLLTQFVSPFTGRVFGRHITALCDKKQKQLEQQIDRAQRAGFMATYLKHPKYFKDPKLYDPENPIKPHKY